MRRLRLLRELACAAPSPPSPRPAFTFGGVAAAPPPWARGEGGGAARTGRRVRWPPAGEKLVRHAERSWNGSNSPPPNSPRPAEAGQAAPYRRVPTATTHARPDSGARPARLPGIPRSNRWSRRWTRRPWRTPCAPGTSTVALVHGYDLVPPRSNRASRRPLCGGDVPRHSRAGRGGRSRDRVDASHECRARALAGRALDRVAGHPLSRGDRTGLPGPPGSRHACGWVDSSAPCWRFVAAGRGRRRPPAEGALALRGRAADRPARAPAHQGRLPRRGEARTRRSPP